MKLRSLCAPTHLPPPRVLGSGCVCFVMLPALFRSDRLAVKLFFSCFTVRAASLLRESIAASAPAVARCSLPPFAMSSENARYTCGHGGDRDEARHFLCAAVPVNEGWDVLQDAELQNIALETTEDDSVDLRDTVVTAAV